MEVFHLNVNKTFLEDFLNSDKTVLIVKRKIFALLFVRRRYCYKDPLQLKTVYKMFLEHFSLGGGHVGKNLR